MFFLALSSCRQKVIVLHTIRRMSRLTAQELLPFVLSSLHRKSTQDALPVLQASFPDHAASTLFRALIFQQVWVHVCRDEFAVACGLLEELGEAATEHLRELWRRTTRNRVRALLYDQIHRKPVFSDQDEENHRLLLKLTQKYPNTDFASSEALKNSPAIQLFKGSPLALSNFDDTRDFVFRELFDVPREPLVDSRKYFVGNIVLIESQPPHIRKMLRQDGTLMEKLWVVHCEQKVTEMSSLVKDELDRAKRDAKKSIKSLKFVNLFASELNTYENETLLNLFCQSGHFVDDELGDFQRLIVRICKNKVLFDHVWWSRTTLSFASFFKQFAAFCGRNGLYMAFEMFVISHPKVKEIDMTDVTEPMILFIWDLWIRRDP
jgi:spatacsin